MLRWLLLPLVLLAAPIHAQEPGLDVAGTVSVSGEVLEVSLSLTNRGAVPVDQVVVQGELLGRTDDARHDEPLLPAAADRVPLRFPLEVPVPGTHALALRLDYRTADASHTPMRQRAYLLLTLGAAAAPVLEIGVAEARLDASGEVLATLRSIDGAPHAVTLRLLTPRGLNPTAERVALDVPAGSSATARLGLLRAGAPRGTRQGVLVVAETVHLGLQRTTVQAGVVRIADDPAWMPRLRAPLALLAGILLGATLGVEVWRHWGQQRG